MTPQEKANELVTKYKSLAYTNLFSFREESNLTNSKKCALVAVDEIIEAIETTIGHCQLRRLDQQEVEMDIDYWNKVKTEIDKL